MAEIGQPLYPWQADCVCAAFATQPNGLWSAFELAVLLSRQNGKGGVTEAIELGSMFLFREPLLMHSSHHFSTTRAAFQRVVDLIDGCDWTRRRVAKDGISRSKGDESITLTRAAGGSRLYFTARTLRAGRGLTGSKTVFDEAAWLTVGQYAAQTPTLATIPNPQIIYTSTPPDDEVGPLPADAMLPSVRRRGLARGSRIALYEWSPGPGFDRSDPDVSYACNPLLGIRIERWFLERQLAAFTAAGQPWKYDTEHLGLWPDDAAQQWQVLAEQEWQAADRGPTKPGGKPHAVMGDRLALGVWVSPDRRWCAVGAAGERTDAASHLVELTGDGTSPDYRPEVGWVLPRVAELVERNRPLVVVTNDRGLAERSTMHLANASDQAAAAGMLYDGIRTDEVRHLGQNELTGAVAGAVKRKVGSGWTWDTAGVDISPVGAVSLALWGLCTERVHSDEPVMPMAAYG